MPFRGFWDELEAPIIGLSPMDGVTDAPFRYITCKYSKPSLVMTEFTNVEGLARGAVKMLRAFRYDETERPVVAQIYGVEIDSFYKATVMLAHLGYDGIDINMGCPANAVAKRGSGAALIQTPELAKEIIRSCKKGTEDFANGITMEEAGVHENIIAAVHEMNEGAGRANIEKKNLPVSVKTRIGFKEIVVEEWVKHLLEEDPANITMHGRTLKQMYMGEANWEEIAKGAAICKDMGTSYLGNGDILTLEAAHQRIKDYNVDGVLIGRATFGNPWFFGDHEPTKEEKFKVAIEHCELFEKMMPEVPFVHMRSHLGWYVKGFDGAREMRKDLMQSNSTEEVRDILI